MTAASPTLQRGCGPYLECLFVVVGARKRESVHGIQKAPPLSGDCFWQLEKANAPLNGEAFVFILCFMRGTLAIIVLKKYRRILNIGSVLL